MLMVTTTLACWLLDTETGRAWPFHTGQDVYYGISFDAGQCYVAARDARYGSERATQNNVILCFDRALRLVRQLEAPQPIRDVHQIMCHRGILWIVSTFDDAILRYDLAAERWSTWLPFSETHAGERNQFHINSVHAADHGILLAGNKPDGWFARFDEAGRPVGVRTPLGRGTHNVWPEPGGAVAVCSSLEGAVVSTAGTTMVVHPRGWLRGVAERDGVRYLGVCQNAVRDVRGGSDASVVAVAADGSILRCFTFEGHGMVHDLRALGTADPTHNGVVFDVAAGVTAGLPVPVETSATLVDLSERPPA